MNTESNKLIAEFMNWNIKSITTIPSNLHLTNIQLDNGDTIELKFETSWDWLMPVVIKCFKVDEQTNGELNFKLNDALLETNINILYNAVLEFIKQLNK
jgi:hypothetical protein